MKDLFSFINNISFRTVYNVSMGRAVLGKRIIFLMTLSTMQAGCASVQSTVLSSTDVQSGLIYYLPIQPIQITVNVDTSGNETPTVTEGTALPDGRYRYALNYQENFVGTNHLTIAAGTNGLLTSSNAITTSGVTQIAKNLGQLAGMISALGAAGIIQEPPSTPPVQSCDKGQSFSTFYFPGLDASSGLGSEPTSICNFSISVTALFPSQSTQVPGAASSNGATAGSTSNLDFSPGTTHGGIFYRQQLPYLITLTDSTNASDVAQFVAFSTDQSPTMFLPASRTLFSNNQTNIGLSNGIITSLDQSTDGEVVALSELPADILSAYFAAIGSLFSSFSSNENSQSTYLTNQEALTLEKQKQQACVTSVNAKGATVASIQAACSP